MVQIRSCGWHPGHAARTVVGPADARGRRATAQAGAAALEETIVEVNVPRYAGWRVARWQITANEDGAGQPAEISSPRLLVRRAVCTTHRDAQRPFLAVRLRDFRPADGSPLILLEFQKPDDIVDSLEVHAIHRFLGGPLRHRPLVTVDFPVSSEE